MSNHWFLLREQGGRLTALEVDAAEAAALFVRGESVLLGQEADLRRIAGEGGVLIAWRSWPWALEPEAGTYFAAAI